MQKPLIPLSLLQDLRCRYCQNFVTCGPVFVVPDENILCGRCQHLAKPNCQNFSYEALSSMFLYPCCNWEDHCSRTLLWNESLEHEKECSYNGCCTFFCNHPGAFCQGKREMPQGDIRLTMVPEHLLEFIKCIQCECYLSCEPVYIQTNGKNICHRCIIANGIPPGCYRNTSYEKLSSIIVFPCIYRNRGCPTRLRFGRDLWQHETECSYGQINKKITKNPNQKEKGVIKTHSGHYYGTITPNAVLFAPPSQQTEFEVKKELLKSLKKQQERRFIRTDELEMQFEKASSDDGSLLMDDAERKHSFDIKISMTDRNSPTRSDENVYNWRQNNNQPEYGGDNNQHNVPVHQNNNKNDILKPTNFYNQSNISTSASNNTPKKYFRQHSNSSSISLSPKSSFIRRPHPAIDNNVLAGIAPIIDYRKNASSESTQEKGFCYNDINNGRLSRTESMNNNSNLIDELKVRQSKLLKQHSIPKESPYKECNNLEDVLQVHNKMRE